MERVPDWSALAAAVERSADEDSIMTRQAITVLLPGTTMLLAAATGMSLVVSSTPHQSIEQAPQIRALSLVDDAVFEMVHQTKGLASPVSDGGRGCDDAHAAFFATYPRHGVMRGNHRLTFAR